MMRHANLDLNDKWTANTPLHGWQHFRIVSRRYAGKSLQVELMAACDTGVRFWLDAKALRDKTQFTPGWTQRSGLQTPPQ